MIIDRLEEDDFEDENHILRSRPLGFLLPFQRTTAQRNFVLLHIFQPMTAQDLGNVDRHATFLLVRRAECTKEGADGSND